MNGLLCVLLCACALHGQAANLKPMDERRDLSFADFINEYAAPGIPVLLKGAIQSTVEKHNWGREYFRKNCGDSPLEPECRIDREGRKKRIQIPHNVKQHNEALRGDAWGSLASSDIEELSITTLGDMLDAQDAGEPLYLHDQSISMLCPSIMDEFTIPKYFPFDLRLMDPHRAVWTGLFTDLVEVPPENISCHVPHVVYDFPSLFIGRKGTQSGLHIDSSSTHFWMAVLDGKKKWVTFQPDQNENIYFNEEGQFDVDVFNPDYEKFPKFADAQGYQTIVEPGDVVYTPANNAHQVMNVEDSIAYSYNYIDAFNVHDFFKMEQEEIRNNVKNFFSGNLFDLGQTAMVTFDPYGQRILQKLERALRQATNDMRELKVFQEFTKVAAIPGVNEPPILTPRDQTVTEFYNHNTVHYLLSLDANRNSPQVRRLLRGTLKADKALSPANMSAWDGAAIPSEDPMAHLYAPAYETAWGIDEEDEEEDEEEEDEEEGVKRHPEKELG